MFPLCAAVKENLVSRRATSKSDSLGSSVNANGAIQFAPSYRPERRQARSSPEGPRSGDIFGDYAFASRRCPDSRHRNPPLGAAPDGAKRKSGDQSRPARPRLVALGPGLNPGRHDWYSGAATIVRRSLISTGMSAPSAGKPALHSQRYDPHIFPAPSQLRSTARERFLRSLRSVEMTGKELAVAPRTAASLAARQP